MSISLVGIIFIQSFFIIKNYEAINNQFTSNVNYVLDQTSSMAERREFRRYVAKFRDLINSDTQLDTTSINNLYIINEDPVKRETIIYKNGVIEENLIFPNSLNLYDDFFNDLSEKESLSIKRLTNQREENVFSNQKLDNNVKSSDEFLKNLGKISKSKEVLFESTYNDLAKRKSIEERVGDIEKFEQLLNSNLNKMNLDLDVEYAIFKKDSLTNIKSNLFNISGQHFKSLIFKDENNLSQ